MSYHNIEFAIDNGIARLTLNRPDKLNSFTAAMHEEIRDALTQVRAVNDVRVLLVTGAGRAFCAGADLADAAAARQQGEVDFGAIVQRDYKPLVLTLRALPMPVVCAVNGVAAGAGANLALACDIVVAKKSASFIQAFVKIGLLPDTGGTYFLPRLVGEARAMGLAMLGEKISAEQAVEWGLIWKCVDDEAFEQEVEMLLSQLASSPTLALAHAKQAIYASTKTTLDEQLDREGESMRQLGRTADHREGVEAFLAKRVAVFHGR